MIRLKSFLIFCLHYMFWIFAVPNPKEYVGYKYLFGIWEQVYYPLGNNRVEYLLNCVRHRTSPWKSKEELKLLVERINNHNGIWQGLIQVS